jgi:hypothetical protein
MREGDFCLVLVPQEWVCKSVGVSDEVLTQGLLCLFIFLKIFLSFFFGDNLGGLMGCRNM